MQKTHTGHPIVATGLRAVEKLAAALVIALGLMLPATLLVSCADDTVATEPGGPWSNIPDRPSHTNHASFFHKPFPDGPSVTKACLECHPKSAEEVMATAHWNWLGEEVTVPGHEQPVRIGKRNVINNFCIGITSNWPACTQCHIGYGWEDESFDFEDPTRVDCLACHDNSGQYIKKYQGAGRPDDSVDLLAAARSVGLPKRKNCGGCHFQGGGGDAIKHGDLDDTLLFPSTRIDIHMGEHDMECIDCHRAKEHLIMGRSAGVSVDSANRLHCTECHDLKPHGDFRLNSHTDRVACQTCHIPYMAVDTGTKLTWDWSEAGQDLDITDEHQYLKIKGKFTWAKKVEPEYFWFNDTSQRYILGDKIDPTKPTVISGPLGNRNDPQAKIRPFKVHRGRQVYDAVNRYFLIPHVHGDQGFWTQFDWPTALRIGAEVTGLQYSGVYDFAPTEMYFPLSHMVTQSDQALQCRDCHGERGRLEWQALGYDSDPLMREPFEHDPVYLFGANGEPVSLSGQPLSTAMTCGMCHDLEDEEFIDDHGYHSSIEEGQLPAERQLLMRDGPRIPHDADQQMNCFLCHIDAPNHAERMRALDGNSEWSVAATLIGTGLVTRSEGVYQWNEEQVGPDGEAHLTLRPVTEANCGACHGAVHDGAKPLVVALGQGEHWTTEKTGQIFSPQRIDRSGMNLKGKDELDWAWDVHAERLVSCGDCHYSTDRPARLAGEATPANVEPATGTRRRCESCHSLGGVHDWLPEKERHLQAVACESCHVPELEMAAQEQVDHTVLRPDGSPVVHYRGIESGDVDQPTRVMIDGYQPLLRTGTSVDGDNKILPYNLVSSWRWVEAATGEAVAPAAVYGAWFENGSYAPDVMRVFDANEDGVLAERELRLVSPAKVELIQRRLVDAGASDPQIQGKVRAYHIHHNIRHGNEVNRDCVACHPKGKAKGALFEIAEYVPGGVLPTLAEDSTQIVLDGELAVADDGALIFRSPRSAAESYQSIREME